MSSFILLLNYIYVIVSTHFWSNFVPKCQKSTKLSCAAGTFIFWTKLDQSDVPKGQ